MTIESLTINPTNAKSDRLPADTGLDPAQQSVRITLALPPAPLILLAPPKTFNSVISAMLGQHPQLYSAPDLNLFAVQSLRELPALYALTNPRQQDGLLRTIAELFLKGQTEDSIVIAKQRIHDNGRMPTIELFKKITTRVAPKILIEKSSSTLWRPAHLLRLKKAFPDARYLHLTRHPRSHARAVLQSLDREIFLRPSLLDRSQHPPVVDPQIMWFQVHDTIDRFLADIPDENQCRMRGEDFIVDTDRTLRKVLAWLGLSANDTMLAAMRHPEGSPYATLGPLNAPFGNNSEFLKDARLQPGFASAESLDEPLEWRDNGSAFASNVRARAEEFGYRLQGLNILVIDDCETSRRNTKTLLTKEGCNVCTATDGFDALAKIANQPPDVILVDIIMPRLDGYETCTLIRNVDRFRNTPMIMLTSKDGQLARTRSQIAGSEQYLTKPFTRDQLVGAISRHMIPTTT